VSPVVYPVARTSLRFGFLAFAPDEEAHVVIEHQMSNALFDSTDTPIPVRHFVIRTLALFVRRFGGLSAFWGCRGRFDRVYRTPCPVPGFGTSGPRSSMFTFVLSCGTNVPLRRSGMELSQDGKKWQTYRLSS
jgi:hypothetical protein